MPLDLKSLSLIDLFAQLRHFLSAADEAQEQSANHRATDQAGAFYNEILSRPDGGRRAFLPFLEDPQPMMRLQAAIAVRDYDLPRVIPVLKDIKENARGLAPSQANMELFALRRDGRL